MDKRFSPNDWDELQNSMMYAYILVAHADGKASRLEAAMLIKVYETSRELDNASEALFRAVMGSAETTKEAVLERSYAKVGAGATCQQLLHKVGGILDKAEPAEALAFKQNLVAGAYLVAKHSKLFPRVTAQEGHALEEVATSLGLT